MAVAIFLANLALSVVQKELRLILTGGLSTLLLSLLLSIVERRSSLVTFSHHCPFITVGRNVDILLRHMDTPPSLCPSPHHDTADIMAEEEGRFRRGVATFRTVLNWRSGGMRACAINCLSGEKGGSALTADVLTEVAIWSWVVFVLWATRDGYGNVP